jgi:hypothetical protein
MAFEPGDQVERRYGRGEHRFGRVTGRVREGYDTWYVTADVGMTFCDNGRDLRLVPSDESPQPTTAPPAGSA